MTTPANNARPTGPVTNTINESNTVVNARQSPQAGPADLFSPSVPVATPSPSVDPVKPSDDGHLRIVEDHHLVGPHREDEIEALDDDSRRWCPVRPEPSSRTEIMSFSYTWWVISIVLLVLVLLPWPGWNY